jgi:Spy/CpxP family protein refolding chaperone
MHKKIFITGFLVLLISLFFIQGAYSVDNTAASKVPERQPGAMKDKFLDQIPNLTDAQRSQIKAIMQEEMQKIQEIRQSCKTKIEAVLTPEQKAALKEKFEKKSAQMKDKMIKELNLTAEQQAKYKAIKEKYEPQLKNASSREQKMDIFKNMKQEMDAVLTDEQKAKLKSLRSQWQNKKSQNSPPAPTGK